MLQIFIKDKSNKARYINGYVKCVSGWPNAIFVLLFRDLPLNLLFSIHDFWHYFVLVHNYMFSTLNTRYTYYPNLLHKFLYISSLPSSVTVTPVIQKINSSVLQLCEFVYSSIIEVRQRVHKFRFQSQYD
jgi:hypothetical protein